MNTFDSDRSAADATTDPSMESWLYRSEGFAEDLDELVPAVMAPIKAAANRWRSAGPALRWPSALTAGWLGRPLNAR